MVLFDNGNPDEFLLFVRNFQINLEASVTPASVTKIQYLCRIVRGKALHQLNMLSVEVGFITLENLNLIILGLRTYFTAVNVMSKQKCTMFRVMRKPCKLKVKCYAARLIYINDYLDTFPGEKASEIFC